MPPPQCRTGNRCWRTITCYVPFSPRSTSLFSNTRPACFHCDCFVCYCGLASLHWPVVSTSDIYVVRCVLVCRSSMPVYMPELVLYLLGKPLHCGRLYKRSRHLPVTASIQNVTEYTCLLFINVSTQYYPVHLIHPIKRPRKKGMSYIKILFVIVAASPWQKGGNGENVWETATGNASNNCHF